MGSVLSHVGNILPPGAQSRSVKKLEKVGPRSTLTHQTVTEPISPKTWKQVPTVNPHPPDCRSAHCQPSLTTLSPDCRIFCRAPRDSARFGEFGAIRRIRAIRDSTNPGCGGAGGDIKRLACDSARRRGGRVRGEMGGVGGVGRWRGYVLRQWGGGPPGPHPVVPLPPMSSRDGTPWFSSWYSSPLPSLIQFCTPEQAQTHA